MQLELGLTWNWMLTVEIFITLLIFYGIYKLVAAGIAKRVKKELEKKEDVKENISENE